MVNERRGRPRVWIGKLVIIAREREREREREHKKRKEIVNELELINAC